MPDDSRNRRLDGTVLGGIMASICGNIVMNNAGSERHFDSREDANRAYALLCDYEAFLSDLVNDGKVIVKDHQAHPWVTTKE